MFFEGSLRVSLHVDICTVTAKHSSRHLADAADSNHHAAWGIDTGPIWACQSPASPCIAGALGHIDRSTCTPQMRQCEVDEVNNGIGAALPRVVETMGTWNERQGINA